MTLSIVLLDILDLYKELHMCVWQGAVPLPESSYRYVVPPPESSEQGAVLPQNRILAASSTRCQVGLVPDFVF